ncbi:AMP-binding protein [Gordonia neofelifaecis]|uniref:AMP-binding enzyme family protein n=1 Tax=Gordonia neofelifaecis NRRL B-59395 TaxID=644548 RepID=F1YK28_9ACTN|nr:AMP-binding protein [Gordonia neofelifaecis]EGD54874.1 AMP-binding enzyme family protein [Gordonia neofelifaecis NRRL B-59395]
MRQTNRQAGEPQANDVPLSPLSFLLRMAEIKGDDEALVTDSGRVLTWADLLDRAERLAGALRAAGVRDGERVAVLAPNDAPLLEAHYGVPGAGAVLVALNTRLSLAEYADLLRRSDVRVLIVDEALADRVEPVIAGIDGLRCVVTVADRPDGYEAWLAAAQAVPLRLPDDERAPLAINFTSGTTAGPKGAVYTHRGCYLNAMSQVVAMNLRADSTYLWTLPMFHCSGWCFTWAVTAVGARHVALRKVDPDRVLDLIGRYDVTHLCGAPVVLNGLVEASRRRTAELGAEVTFAVGGAPPTPAAIAEMREIGVEIVHLYGMTETYGPSLVCELRPEWAELDASALARKVSRQGVRTLSVESARVVTGDLRDVPADGETPGELAIRSNTVISHYLDDLEATARAFAGGWLHTGDAAVRHPDGYIEIRDRIKDVIISGGENISSIEVENALADHPAVRESAVVARAHPKWGEVPVAHVALRDGAVVSDHELIDWLRDRIAHFKVPAAIVFGELPKTATGKIQKSELRAIDTRPSI